MFFCLEWCKWELSISNRIRFICRSECVGNICVNRHLLQAELRNTSETQTIVLRQHMLVSHKHNSKALVTWKEIAMATNDQCSAGRPIWWIALGDLIDVARISWEFKSMFSLRCVTGKGCLEILSISDPETNNCRECVDFV